MDLMWIIWLHLLTLSYKTSVGQVCRVSNVQIDNEDGRKSFIELNLKKLDIGSKNSCPGCDSRPGTQYSHWIATPPTFQVLFVQDELFAECDYGSLASGLCSKAKDSCSIDGCELEEIEELVRNVRESNLFSEETDNERRDKNIARALVYLNVGHLDEAIVEFTAALNLDAESALAYLGRGAAYARKGLKHVSNAIADFTKAAELRDDRLISDVYVNRANIYLRVGLYREAQQDASSVLRYVDLPKIYFLHGIASLMLEDFQQAEDSFRRNLIHNSYARIKTLSHFHLGLALYYHGKIRNAIEVFKEVLKENPDHLEASLSLAHAFKELGNIRASASRLTQAAASHPSSSAVHRLRGDLMYETGVPATALVDFKTCLDLDPTDAHCVYMSSAAKLSLGQFYTGVQDATKLMVTNIPNMKASPDFIKSHYLREYGRYVHRHLDSPVETIKPDMEFDPLYLDNWVHLRRFDYTNYKEQPGLQPHIKDVDQTVASDLDPEMRRLVCRAWQLGKLSQVSADGVKPNKRLTLATGLAALHTAQVVELKWKALKTLSKSSSNEKVLPSWRDLYSVAVGYRRLASLDEPVLWVENLLSFLTGHRSDIPFVRGSVKNSKVTPYYELAFKLAKTLLEHYTGDGAVVYEGLEVDIHTASSVEDLLNIAKRRNINPSGFMVSTQVPSLGKVDGDRLEGGVLMLAENHSHQAVFSLSVLSTPPRTVTYSAEMDHLLALLQHEMKGLHSSKAHDVDTIISHILSMAYYFYNLVPLTKGSSAVAYSVMLGLLLSVGRQITGRIPNGRMLDLEAMLAGAPDAFVLVAKKWMNIKKTTVPVSSLPRVWEVLPTVRNVLEVLSYNTTAC